LAGSGQQQKALREQEREGKREYIDRESHYMWGKRYLLKVVEEDAAPSVQIWHSKLLLHVRPGTGVPMREEVLSSWYRQLLSPWSALSILLSTRWPICWNPHTAQGLFR